MPNEGAPMRIITILGALALTVAACARAPAPAPVYRDTGRLIGAAALFDPARFIGDWQVVAAYPLAGCDPDRLTYDGARMALTCAGGPVLTSAAPVTAPGRFGVAFDGVVDVPELWVIWADFDYRTVILGAPDGTVGLILDRQPTIPADRMAAAREMLDFNGYDLTALRSSAP